MLINLNNVEELIFYDNKIKKMLPEFNDLFSNWAFAKQYSGFRQLSKRAVLDFLERIEPVQIDTLEQYFCTKVIEMLRFLTIELKIAALTKWINRTAIVIPE